GQLLRRETGLELVSGFHAPGAGIADEHGADRERRQQYRWRGEVLLVEGVFHVQRDIEAGLGDVTPVQTEVGDIVARQTLATLAAVVTCLVVIAVEDEFAIERGDWQYPAEREAAREGRRRQGDFRLVEPARNFLDILIGECCRQCQRQARYRYYRQIGLNTFHLDVGGIDAHRRAGWQVGRAGRHTASVDYVDELHRVLVIHRE